MAQTLRGEKLDCLTLSRLCASLLIRRTTIILSPRLLSKAVHLTVLAQPFFTPGRCLISLRPGKKSLNQEFLMSRDEEDPYMFKYNTLPLAVVSYELLHMNYSSMKPLRI
jgi:hypothetical protein